MTETAAWFAFGEVSAGQFSPKNANSSVQVLERWIFKSKFISSYIQRTLMAHCWEPAYRNIKENKDTPVLSLYISYSVCYWNFWKMLCHKCSNSIMCFFCISLSVLLKIQTNGKKRKENLIMLFLYTKEKIAKAFYQMLSQQGWSVCFGQMQLLPAIFSLLLLVTCSYGLQLA